MPKPRAKKLKAGPGVVYAYMVGGSGAGGTGKTTLVTPSHYPVNHPPHYTAHPSGIECIAITRHMNFNLGNVVKYVWRADHKGASLQDLKKAQFYLNDEINRREKNA